MSNEKLESAAARDAIGALSPAKRALLAQMLAARKRAPEAIPPRDATAVVPLTPGQRVLWLFDRVAEGRSAYNIVDVWRLRGALDADALRAALGAVVDRHESLRTIIGGAESDPVLVVRPPHAVPWELHDLRRDASLRSMTDGDTLVSSVARRPFDLTADIPVRALLVRLDDEEWRLALVLHHIAADGWSRGIILRELASAYRQARSGDTVTFTPIPVQFGDYAVWLAAQLDSPAMAPHIAFWRSQLAMPRPVLTFPTDRPREAQRTGAGAVLRQTWPRELADAVAAMARRARATPFMVLLAAWQAVLARHAGQDEVIVGTPVAGRSRPELESVVGYFANTLPIRTTLADDPTFLGLVERVRDTVLAAFEHQDVPLEAMLPDAAASSEPLFRALFALQNYERAALTLDGVAVIAEPLTEGTARVELTLGMVEREDGFRVALEFATELFDRATAERLLARFRHFLATAAASPDARVRSISLLPDDERSTLLRAWNPPGTARWPAATVHALFEERVRSAPDAIAVEDASVYVPGYDSAPGERAAAGRLTYRELNECANAVAWRLREIGIGPETRVAVCLEKSAGAIAALLGVLKAGGAYVPVDPAYPDERIAFLLADSGARAIVTSDTIVGRLKATGIVPPETAILVTDGLELVADHRADPPPLATPRSLCYVIYTSGSTGKPKGVLIEHEQVVQLVCNDELPFEFGATDVWTVFHSLAFDFSVWEMYGALLWGGRTIVVPRALAQDPAAYALLIARAGVTVVNQTPSAFYALMQEAIRDGAPQLSSVRYVVFGGEALQPALLAPWHARYPDAALINMFGITETTVHVTVKRIEGADIELGASNVGRALPPLSVYVLDERLEPVPVGVVGELCVGGAGVARGYLNRPELTSERFVADPFTDRAGARLYRSGDLARWREDGELEYLGRRDAQVKLRGHRIELGEIEAAIGRHPAVAACAATVRTDSVVGPRLVAYFVAAPPPPAAAGGSAAPLAPASLATWVADRLPQYMVPSVFVPVDALPLTSNGKVNRAALPAPPVVVDAEGDEPRTDAEHVVAGVWRGILGAPSVPRSRSFFELGGHSLLAARLVGQVNRIFRTSLTLRAFFEAPTVADVVAGLVAAEPKPGQIEAIAQLLRKVQSMSPEERARLRDEHVSSRTKPDFA